MDLRHRAATSMSFLALLLVLSLSVTDAFVPAAKCGKSTTCSPSFSTVGFAVRKIPFTTVPRTTNTLLQMSKTDKELVCITKVSPGKYDVLSEYIQEWAQLLQRGGVRFALATPVTVTASDAKPSGNVENVSGVKFLFQKTQTGDAYKSKEEERAIEEGEEEAKPEKNVSEGGVEVLVEQLKDGKVQVRARRCDVEDDTIIKEMSEESIASELAKAVEVFNRQQVSSNEAKWS